LEIAQGLVNIPLGCGARVFLVEGQGVQRRLGKNRKVGMRGVDARAPAPSAGNAWLLSLPLIALIDVL
jgi:hypothetical protein